MNTELPAALFDYLDAVANLEFKAKRALQGATAIRYEGAREVAGGPLSRAATDIIIGLPAGSTVIMTTGAGNPLTLPFGETDGPPGLAFLAKVLAQRGHPLVVTADAHFLSAIEASLQAVELERAPDRLTILPFPLGAEAGVRAAADILATFPDASSVIFIEKPGPNASGVFHTSSGKPKDPESVSHLHELAILAGARGLRTISVGDGGNEIGFGRVSPVIADCHPLGLDCGCPCGAGILNTTAVDCMFAASISNWGAYAIAFGAAMAAGQPQWLPSRDTVADTIQACIRAGANDGYSGENVATVDGTSLAANLAIYDLFQEVIQKSTCIQ